jgi:carboxymethylenebutenolidase
MGEMIDLTCEDGVTISAWRAHPRGVPKGGIVVLQEIFGVNHHIRSVTTRFAQAGYLAIAPALFDRVEKNAELRYDGVDFDRAIGLVSRTKIDDTLRDIAAAIKLASDGGKVGIVGYCWGGTLAWLTAARLAGTTAAVGYYGGGIASNIALAPRVPVMLHFGAHDKHIPLSDVEKVRAGHPAVPVFVYDADHGFNCDERASYDAPSADAARARTLDFFETSLR